MVAAAKDDPHGWREEGKDIVRAIAAGAIVGTPIIYTMEVWEHGVVRSELYIIGVICAAIAVNWVFCRYSGFRRTYSATEALSESLTSVGLALVISAGALWLIGELTPQLSLQEMIGKAALCSVAVSIGISFANTQIREKTRDGEEQEQDKPDDPVRAQWQKDLRDAGATLAGATVLALNITPTEEVRLIATQLEAWRLILLFAVEMVMCYLILFASGFTEHRVYSDTLFQKPLAETILTCAISLVVAGGLLILIGESEAWENTRMFVSCLVVLGMPAVVGGAAGRLIL